MSEKILEVKNLVSSFKTTNNECVVAVRGVSFSVYKGKSFGIVGESGSGKSTVALSIMRLIKPNVGTISGDGILLQGVDILRLSDSAMRKIRGNKISMIFQEPMTSLNPVFTIGNQIQESILTHNSSSNKEAKDRCIELLNLVGIPVPEKRIYDYPHQLSGGMRQRVMIAMALACNPDVLIADEPTTALDVTIQAQVLDLMRRIQSEMDMGIILITHDLGIISEMCDEVAVMYCGKIVEHTDVKSLFSNPMHPYTQKLIASIPSLNYSKEAPKRLYTIDGVVPCLNRLPFGCTFQNRCNKADISCTGKNGEPELIEVASGHLAACFHTGDSGPKSINE